MWWEWAVFGVLKEKHHVDWGSRGEEVFQGGKDVKVLQSIGKDVKMETWIKETRT